MSGGFAAELRTQRSSACLALLFAPGRRPDNAALARICEDGGRIWISHDPARDADADTNANDGPAGWVEMLIDGLTFDALGLAPGPALEIGPPRHTIGLGAEQLAGCEAIAIAPGPHLSGAGNALPVMRGLLEVGSRIMSASDGTIAAQWLPAASAMGRPMFLAMVESWLEGGAFPGLGLIGFDLSEEGALISDGLGFFIGCELQLAPSLCADKVAAAKLAIRIIDRLVAGGEMPDEGPLTGPAGEPLRIVKPAAGKVIVLEQA